MKKKLTRRDFIKSGICGVTIASTGFTKVLGQNAAIPDIAVSTSSDIVKNVNQVIAALGGMNKFVKKGDKVVLLPNPQGRQISTATNPQVVAEIVKLCLDAGAADVSVCSVHSNRSWQNTGIIEAVEAVGGKMFYPGQDSDYVKIKIPKGKILKETTLLKKAVENDVFINLPIAKQHDSTRFTCTLKNLMGFNTNNSSFHKGPEHLHQCIVDLASVIKPDLCVVDANTILIENGPFGPGKTISPQKVYAGTDMVSIDALCCQLINIKSQDVPHILGAYQLGLGEVNIDKLLIKSI